MITHINMDFFNPSSGRGDLIKDIVSLISQVIQYLKELIQIVMHIQLRPGDKHALCYKNTFLNVSSRKKKSHEIVYINRSYKRIENDNFTKNIYIYI